MARRYLTKAEEVIDLDQVRRGRWAKYGNAWGFVVAVYPERDRVLLSDWCGLKTKDAPLSQVTHVADYKDPVRRG